MMIQTNIPELIKEKLLELDNNNSQPKKKQKKKKRLLLLNKFHNRLKAPKLPHLYMKFS